MNDKRSIKDIINGVGKPPAEPLPVAEETEEVPQDVGPCGWVWAKGCHAIDIERGGTEPVVALQYVYLSVYSEFRPGEFWVMFVGLTSWKVTVKGRNLRPLFDRLQDHCLRRIRQAIRDFGGDDGKPSVTNIEVVDVTPKERE